MGSVICPETAHQVTAMLEGAEEDHAEVEEVIRAEGIKGYMSLKSRT